MIIKILPKQIPIFWEAIKFGATQADEIDKKDMQLYLNELLQALLNDKAQCFAALNDERILSGLLVTRVVISKITEEKSLLLQSLYVWEAMENQMWQEAFNLIYKFAMMEQCKTISLNSRNKLVWRRAESFGFKEISRAFSLSIS